MSTRISQGNFKSHVCTVKVSRMGLFADRGSVRSKTVRFSYINVLSLKNMVYSAQQIGIYRTVKSKGGNFVVKYCMSLSDEKKETAIKIALESNGNVRKRKIAVPLLMILGIVIIFSSIFLIINSPAILWYVYMVIGIVCLLLAFNAKSFQKFVLKKAELLLDKSFRTGIVEYHFDAEGIETISQMGYSKNYWTAFKEYGTMGQYIYVKRKDNKMVLIDKNDLSTGELEELTQLLLDNVKM